MPEHENATGPLSGDLFVGLSGLQLTGGSINLANGVKLESTFAHVMMPVTVAFSPPNDQGYHPPPWKAARGGFGHDITAQLIIPAAATTTVIERLEMARVITFLIRLWSDPSITMPAASNMDFSRIAEAADGAAYIVTLEGRPRSFCLEPASKSEIHAGLQWVVQNFESAWNLWRTALSSDLQFMLRYWAVRRKYGSYFDISLGCARGNLLAINTRIKV